MESMTHEKSARQGFTLIEMLAVIVIIAILASLITVAAIAALNRAKAAAIRQEIASLEAALGAYIPKYGMPPDFTDPDAVTRHLKRRFPLCPEGNYPDFGGQSPASALVFWLGGPNGNGFSADAENPFGNSESRTETYAFEASRLQTVDGVLVYYPNIGSALNSCPLVYFSSHKGGYEGKSWNTQDGDEVRPYKTMNEGWVNPQSYQIISAGLDNRFGSGYTLPPSGGDKYDYDNITNFTKGTLDDER